MGSLGAVDRDVRGAAASSEDGATAAPPELLRGLAVTDRSLLSASSLTVVSRACARLAQIAFVLVAARLLTIQEFAEYSYLLALAITFSMLADTGVALAAAREISNGTDALRRAFWSAQPLVAAGMVFAAAAVLVFGLVDSGPGTSGWPLVLVTAFVAANTLFNFWATMLRSVGRFRTEALLQTAGAAVFIGAAVGLLEAGQGLTAVLAVLCAKEIGSAMIAFGLLRREVGAPMWPGSAPVKRLLRIGVVLGLASSCLALAARIPLIVLGNTGSADQLAWLSAPQRITDAALVIGLTVGYALLPGISYLAGEEGERARRLINRTLWLLGSTSGAVGVLGVLFAHASVVALFGMHLEPATAAARVLFAAVPACVLLGVAWFALVALGGVRHVLVVGIVGVVCSAVLAAVLVGPGHDGGAAWAYTVSLTAMAVTAVGLIRGRLGDGRSS